MYYSSASSGSLFLLYIQGCLRTLPVCFALLLTTSSAFAQQQFSAKFLGDYGNVTVMEGSGNYNASNADGTVNAAPRQVIAQEFFKTHKDEYDFLVIFTNFDFQLPEGEAKAFYEGVKNDTQGIGIAPFDYTALYGSKGVLQGTVDIGNIINLVTDPLDPKFEDTLYMLSHELMHRWGASIKLKDASGDLSPVMLGKSGDHWSYLLGSDSVLYGNRWQDNGNGTFTSLGSGRSFSPLDLYLMGMIGAERVLPMLLIENPFQDPDQIPQAGVTISGTARYITVDDIIAAEGPRVPNAATSQKSFKTAFILLTTPGSFTGNELYGIENIRSAEVTRFSVLTGGKSIMQIAPAHIENIPTNPGVVITPTTPRTMPPNINDGVQWLISNQKPDGSWADLPQTAERDTALSALSLTMFPNALQNYQNAVQWLGSMSSGNVDFLARKITALTSSGQDIAAFVSDLLSRQNADGGWGSDQNYASNPMDTSLALKALSAAGYGNQAAIGNAIGYLKLQQNSDGGWGSEDKGGMVQESSNVLSAFNAYRAAYQLDGAISRGTTWLIGKQNSDYGFGNSPSNLSEIEEA